MSERGGMAADAGQNDRMCSKIEVELPYERSQHVVVVLLLLGVARLAAEHVHVFEHVPPEDVFELDTTSDRKHQSTPDEHGCSAGHTARGGWQVAWR